jgi:hypothetical protein
MNGFIMKNGNFIECKDGENHSDACRRLGYANMGDLYDDGLMRVSYIGEQISVDAQSMTLYQFLTLQNRCLYSRKGLYVAIYKRGSADLSYKEICCLSSHIDLFKCLLKD